MNVGQTVKNWKVLELVATHGKTEYWRVVCNLCGHFSTLRSDGILRSTGFCRNCKPPKSDSIKGRGQ